MKTKYSITLPDGRRVSVAADVNLRTALRDHWDQLYHRSIRPIHCRGLGTCGTCAVHITGEVTPPTKVERWRLNFPPHKNSLEKGIRLACQCRPLSDLTLDKKNGKWGQGKP